MTVYQSKYATKVRNFSQPEDSNIQDKPCDVDFPAVALVANDIIQLVDLVPGVTLQDYEFHFPDIDTGTPAIAWSFGVLNAAGTDLATVYASGITAGQSNAIVRNTNSDCAQDAANNVLTRRLGLKCTTAAATYAGAGKTGTVVLRLRG